jgi:hypothetical protein
VNEETHKTIEKSTKPKLGSSETAKVLVVVSDHEGNINVAAGGVGVRANLMSLGNQALGVLLRQARNVDLQLGGDAQLASSSATQSHLA